MQELSKSMTPNIRQIYIDGDNEGEGSMLKGKEQRKKVAKE